MSSTMQDPSSSAQASLQGLFDLYQQLKLLDARRCRLRDAIERVEIIQERSSDEEDRQEAKAQLLTLKSADSGVDVQVTQMRNSANELSQPFLRPLHILDLPDEILVTIFGDVRGWNPWHDGHGLFWDHSDQVGTQYIQNVRLTCRRFCSTSSEFLVNCVPVELSYASLAKLEKIASHPAIGKGVTDVHVYLAVHDNMLAGNLVPFIEFHNYRLLEKARMLQGPLRELMGYSEENALEHTERIRKISQAWTSFAQDTASNNATEEDLGFRRLLERGFEEYRDRYAEQQVLLDDGVFVAKVASAMAAMPAFKRLAINDGEKLSSIYSRKDKRIPFDVKVLDDERLCEGLFKGERMSYEVQHHRAVASDAIPVIPSLLAALDAADVRIISLKIELSTMCDFSRLAPTADVRNKIGSAMHDLEAFEFSNHGPAFARSYHQLEALRDFLTPVINTEKLKSLCVRLNLWDDDSGLDPALMSLVSVIRARIAWTNLSSLILDTLHIHHSDLEHLLDCVRSPQGYVGLHKVHLIDGTWTAVLDKLKEKHRWADLSSPSGAECEEISLEEYDRVFGPYDYVGHRTLEEEAQPRTTEAETYIRGWGAGNPLILPDAPESD